MSVAKSEQHRDLGRADRTEDILNLADQQVRDPGASPTLKTPVTPLALARSFKASRDRASRGPRFSDQPAVSAGATSLW